MSLKIKPTRSLPSVALGTALVLLTYVTPMATLPQTAAALNAGAAEQAWMLSGMPVGLAGALLATGLFGDNHGRRRIYLAGLAAVGVGAVVCALAPEPVLFVGGRVMQGVVGAAVLACGLAVLAHDYPTGTQRVHATSVWGASVGLGITAGALLSAAFDTHWRESYVVVAVATAVLLALSARRMSESSSTLRRPIDLRGLALLVAVIALLVATLTAGRSGIDVGTVALTVATAVALVAFVVVEIRVRTPLFEPELLRDSRFRAATTGSFAVGAGITAMASFVPSVAQVGLGTGLWPASLLVVAWSGTSVVTSYLIRHLRRPLTGPAPVAGLLVVVAVGQLLGYGLNTSSSPWRLLPAMFLAGLATGMLNALLGREAVASVPPDRVAMGSGANNTARYLGAAVGITLFVVVATHSGANLAGGWNTAVLVSAAITLVGAATVALGGRRGAVPAPLCATNKA